VITSTLLTLVVVPVLWSYLVRERRPVEVAARGPGGAGSPAFVQAPRDD
jgi:hypothetical protein